MAKKKTIKLNPKGTFQLTPKGTIQITHKGIRYYGGLGRRRFRDPGTARRVHWSSANQEGRVPYKTGRGVGLPLHADIRKGISPKSVAKAREMRREFKKHIRQEQVTKYVKIGGTPGPGQTGRALRHAGRKAANRQLRASAGKPVEMTRSGKGPIESLRKGKYPQSAKFKNVPMTTMENVKMTTAAGTKMRRARSTMAMKERIAARKAPAPPKASTLLKAMWESGGDEIRVKKQLKSGSLKLTGTFKGKEGEVAGSMANTKYGKPQRMKAKQDTEKLRRRGGPKSPAVSKAKNVKIKQQREIAKRRAGFKTYSIEGGWDTKRGAALNPKPVNIKGKFVSAKWRTPEVDAVRNPPLGKAGSALNRYAKAAPKTSKGIKIMTGAAKTLKAVAPVVKTAGKLAGPVGILLSIPSQARGYTQAAGEASKGKYRKAAATAVETFTGTRPFKEDINKFGRKLSKRLIKGNK